MADPKDACSPLQGGETDRYSNKVVAFIKEGDDCSLDVKAGHVQAASAVMGMSALAHALVHLVCVKSLDSRHLDPKLQGVQDCSMAFVRHELALPLGFGIEDGTRASQFTWLAYKLHASLFLQVCDIQCPMFAAHF